MGQRIRFHRELIEFGALPIAKWLGGDEGPAAVQQLLHSLLESAVQNSQQQYLVDSQTLTRCLDVSPLHASALVDVLTAVRPTQDLQPVVTQLRPGAASADAVDVHAVALFLFAQVYVRRHNAATQQPALDVWPGQSPTAEGAPIEPSSPKARNNHTAHFLQQRSNAVVRKELAAHLHQQQALLAGYLDFLQRSAPQLLALCLSRQPPPGEQSLEALHISAAEVDRAALLLAPLPEDRGEDGGSPMDATPTPFTADTWRLSLAMPMFRDQPPETQAPLSAVADWLAANIVDDSSLPESMVSSPTHSTGSRGSLDSLPPAGQIVQGGVVDVQGVCKSTVVRGEDGFPSGTLRVSDCHDTVVYALAPLQFASVFACSDCTVVLGAAGRMVRIERCERVQLIAAAARVIISSCHDCILHLGVNSAPLLIGDNRFLQLAPYNTQYERLTAHMEAAGVFPEPNLWDSPISLAREHGRATPDTPTSAAGGGRPSGGSPTSGGGAGAGGGTPHSPGSPTGGPGSPPPAAVSLLPPDRLLPFMVPFRGGRGPLCGGAATAAGGRWSADLGSLVGLGSDSEGGGGGSPHAVPQPVFPLPPEYEEAKERKVASVADLRNAVKTAQLDDERKRELHSVIQAHFKEWLLSSGSMRQVYDLARMERDDPQREDGPSGSSNPSL